VPKNARWTWSARQTTLALFLGLAACGDKDTEDSADEPAGTGGTSADDTGETGDSGGEGPGPAEALVSGEAGREFSTCPPNQDGKGTLCFFLLETCYDLSSAVSTMALEDADMSWPTNTVAFELSEVPDGTWQLWGFLDDDSSGCDGDITYGDFYLEDGCLEVTVTDQADVTGIEVTFDSKCPAG